MKKSQKEINHLKAEKDQLYKERECEIKARLAAEKLASTHKGKFSDNTPNQSQILIGIGPVLGKLGPFCKN